MEKVSPARAFSELGSLYLSVQVLREENAAQREAIESLKAQVALRDAELERLRDEINRLTSTPGEGNVGG